MPSWKKVITSGSNAALNHITSSGNISGSFQSTGSFGQLLSPQNGNATATLLRIFPIQSPIGKIL